jgi:hypothetical protein
MIKDETTEIYKHEIFTIELLNMTRLLHEAYFELE